MKIIQSIMTKNPCYTAGKKIAVKGLMLHSIGVGQPKATVLINSRNKSSFKSACVHAFIDGNTGDVYQTLPWNHRGWHGGGSSNNTHVGVEMCEPAQIKYTGGANFIVTDVNAAKAVVKRTYESAVELFAHLCKEYNLNPLGDGVIVGHAEGHKRGIASNHADPEHLWRGLRLPYTMDGFRKDVKAAMSKASAPVAPTKTNVIYRVQVGAYGKKSNAVNMQKRLKADGYDAIIVEVEK
jgi:N-acetylmuramoyl-L-alanine amidase CwlA